MNTLGVDGLVARLNRLERENRDLKCVGAAMLVGIAALMLMGQTSSAPRSVVEARRFVLRDSQGTERATLGIETDGRPAFFILDRSGRRRLGLGLAADDGAPAVVLSDQRENIRASLWLESDGTPALGLGDGTPSRRALNLQAGPDGPSLALVVANLGSLTLRVVPEKGAGFALFDQAGSMRAFAALDASGKASFGVNDRGGKPVWRAP